MSPFYMTDHGISVSNIYAYIIYYFIVFLTIILSLTAGKKSFCHNCTRNCPMSLEVEQMVKDGSMNNSECILCGECVDSCKSKAVQYGFGNPNFGTIQYRKHL